MNSSIYIDPQVDLLTNELLIVIIEFRTRPAKVAVATSTTNLSLEQAKVQVEKSHINFRRDLEFFWGERHLSYTIVQSYKDSFNGVALELPGIAINELLSSKVIKAIYSNREVSIPKQPMDTRYQI